MKKERIRKQSIGRETKQRPTVLDFMEMFYNRSRHGTAISAVSAPRTLEENRVALNSPVPGVSRR